MKKLISFLTLISLQAQAWETWNSYAVPVGDSSGLHYETELSATPIAQTIQTTPQSQQPDYGFRGSFPAYHVPDSIQNEGIDE